MKKLLIIWLCVVSVVVNATNYYVAPAGSDAAAGTIGAPWATLDKAFDTAIAGDTVFFRGGTYYPTSESQLGLLAHSGTAGSPICFFNYPGETPVFDCSGVTADAFTYAIRAYIKDYVEIKGLTICNLYQSSSSSIVQAIIIEAGSSGGNYAKIENCVVHTIEGVGIGLRGYLDGYITNCDAYDLCDSLQSPYPGQNGVGFAISTNAVSYGSGMYNAHITIEGCRTWNFSDNGFACGGVGTMEFKNCWAFNGGMLYGEGCGFKYGSNSSSTGDLTNPRSRYIYNCISALNGHYGFSPNNLNSPSFNGSFYNNFMYYNGYKPELENVDPTWGVGVKILNYIGTQPDHEMYANNIAYDNELSAVYAGDAYTHEYNSWDISVTVTDADFVSLDWTEMLADRKADNTLPNINFGRLVEGSDLIDAGTDVGLAYTGIAPDLGWAEYDSETASSATDILTFTLPTQTGAATINTTAHTVAIEVNYLATITNLTPYIAVSYGATISPESMTSRDFTTPQTYTVTALDGTTTQSWTVTVTQEEGPTPSSNNPPVHNGRWIVHEGVWVKI